MREDVFEMYLEEINHVKSCDQAENEKLLKELAAGNKAVKDRLIEGNLKVVLELVREYLNKGISAGDLVQEGNMALVMAVHEYEGGGFDSFLKERVKTALLAAVEEQSLQKKTAQKMVDRINELKDISAEMAEELGREATVEELARRMELTTDEIKDIMKMTLDAMSVADGQEF